MIIWITGASTGIGRSVALAYCKQGATVFATARSADKLLALEEEANQLSGQMITDVADVLSKSALRNAYDHLLEKAGPPDKVILNAGTYFPTPANKFSTEEHSNIMATNYGGVTNCLDVLLPHLISTGSSQIAIVASVAGYRGLPNASAYSASKAALISLAESLREDFLKTGIDLRVINPGFVKTPLTDQNDFHMPFLMDVDAAAQRIIKGLEGNSFEIAFPTRFALIMKLLRILPDRVFFAVSRKMSG